MSLPPDPWPRPGGLQLPVLAADAPLLTLQVPQTRPVLSEPPDDTQLSWDAWDAKVDALLAEMQRCHEETP